MELLIVTGVQAYKSDIKQLLINAGVKVFSITGVTGYKELDEVQDNSNWFSTESGEHQSVLFYAFAENNKTEAVLNSVNEFNMAQNTQSHMHAAVLNIKNII